MPVYKKFNIMIKETIPFNMLNAEIVFTALDQFYEKMNVSAGISVEFDREDKTDA